MAITDKQMLKYYRNKELAEQVILRDASKDKHVIYGARAINKQLPSYLNKNTDDFDIFSSTPKQDAFETEKKLDKAYGGDLFAVEKGQYPNTWKVKNKITRKTTADYTFPNESKIPNKVISGNRYAKIGWIKQKIKQSIKKPENAFRFDKDYEALQRIKLYEKEKGFLLG